MLRTPRQGFGLASLFVCFCCLTGCLSSAGIEPQAQRLAPSRVATGSAIAHAEKTAAWPTRQWWQAYHDPQLNDWMALTLAGSPTLALAAARVRQAQALAGVAEAAEAPQVGLEAQVQRKRWPQDDFYGPGSLGRTSSWNNTQALTFGYDLDLWGRERYTSERALDLAQVATVEARAAALELQGNVLRAYVQLARQFAEADIARAEVAQQEQLLSLAKRRLQAGLGTQLEVSQAEAPLPEAGRQLDSAEEAIALTRHQLAALAGQGPGQGERLQRPQLALDSVPALPENLPLELLGHRPDIVARRWQVAAEAHGIEAAKAAFYPNINLLGSLGSAAVQGGVLDVLRYDKLTYGLGPALTLPIFDGGRLRAELGEQTAAYDLAVQQYNQTLIAALKSVADPLVRLHSLEVQRHFAADGLAVAQNTWRLAQVAQQRGLTDYSAVLQAQSRVFQQQRIQQQVLAAQLSVQADLWVALGGGALSDEVQP